MQKTALWFFAAYGAVTFVSDMTIIIKHATGGW